MNKRQKLVQQQFLNNEEAVIKRLRQVYSKSYADITAKSKALYDEFEKLKAEYDLVDDEAEKAVLRSRMQSKIYQKKYQDALGKQVSGILDRMNEEQFVTVSDYLNKCYEEGFVGTLYDMQGQGLPMAFPLDQESMVRAVQLDSPISEGLYNRLGEDVGMLKKHITAQVSRGISTGMMWDQIARNISDKMTGTYNNPKGSYAYAKRIARTEGHRIQNQAAMDACQNAKDRGADIIKQWDSTLDGKTRTSHINVDGEFKELDEKFSNGLMFPGDPNGGAAEVVNCRCALLQRARWAVGGGFTKMNNFTKQLETFESPEAYEDFKKAFFSKENKQYMNYISDMENKHKTKDFRKVLDKMDTREYNHYSKLLESNPLFNKKAKKIEDCTTTQEVVELFKSHSDWFYEMESNGKIIRSVDGINLDGVDLESAKAVYRPFEAVFEKFPQLKGKLNAANSAKFSKTAYAECFFGFGHGGISVNTRYYSNIDKLKKVIANDEKHGFHPKGLLTPDSVVMHELGHAIDDYLSYALNLGGSSNKGKVKTVSAVLRPKVMKASGLTVNDIGKEVSGYATKDSLEWFAECFSEYMCSDNPRKVATEFGKQLEEIMKGVQ